MVHKIGMDYRQIIKTRKNKKSLPLIGKLKKKINVQAAKDQLLPLLKENEEKLKNGLLELDPSATEHTYDLKKKDGEDFIDNYDEFYKRYSAIGFQEMTDEAKNMGSKMKKAVSDFTPVQRLKGMTNTASEFYHPYYDERNYTKPTNYCTDYINEFLHSFKSISCRSAVVALHPGRFITKHFDIGAEYITRLQIPIVTNENAVIGVKTTNGWNEYHLPADGSIFLVNAGVEHYAINSGNDVRYQIRVCLQSQEDLEDIEDYEPTNFVSDEEFNQHPCSGNNKKYKNILKESLKEFNLEKSGKANLE